MREAGYLSGSWIARGSLCAAMAFGAANSARADCIHRYSFADGAKDSVGHVDGVLKGTAKVADGKLTLDNGDKTSGDADISYLQFASPILPNKGSASIVVWFTGKDVGQFSRLVDIGGQDTGSGTAFIYLTPRTSGDTSRAAISATDTSSKSAVDGDKLDDGKPHMLAAVIDGTGKKLHLFVDGKEVGTAADLGDNTLDKVKQEHAWVGRSGFDSDPALSATIDELRVYDEALTADQAAAQFSAGPHAALGK
jgi:hypothetical protein